MRWVFCLSQGECLLFLTYYISGAASPNQKGSVKGNIGRHLFPPERTNEHLPFSRTVSSGGEPTLQGLNCSICTSSRQMKAFAYSAVRSGNRDMRDVMSIVIDHHREYRLLSWPPLSWFWVSCTLVLLPIKPSIQCDGRLRDWNELLVIILVWCIAYRYLKDSLYAISLKGTGNKTLGFPHCWFYQEALGVQYILVNSAWLYWCERLRMFFGFAGCAVSSRIWRAQS